MIVNSILTTLLIIIQQRIGEFKSQKSVLVSPVTDQNFKKFVKSHDFVLLLFSASWCSKCQKMFPDFEFAAYEAIRNDPPIFFGEVICDETGGKTCEKEDITTFPSLKFYKYGKYSDFFHYRSRENIATFALKYITPKIEVLNTTGQLKYYLNTTTYGVVGFFEKETVLKKAYLEVANILYDRFDFAKTKSKNILNYQRVTDGVVVYKPWYMRNQYESDNNIYKKQGNKEKLLKFLIRNYHGLVGFRRTENQKEFKKPLVIVYYDFDFSKNLGSAKFYRNQILEIAKKYKKSKINFAMSHHEEFKDDIEDKFGVVYKGQPIATIEKDYNKRYLLSTEFKNLESFVESFLNSTLKPLVKSADLTSQENSTILEVSYNSFRKEIIQNRKEIFLEIYDRNCRVSKKVDKPFRETAEALQNEILFARLDISKNDVPNIVKVSSTPTFYFIKKGKKVKTIKYFGHRNSKAFLKFITQHKQQKIKDEL